MNCTELAARIETLQPDAMPRDVARLCLLLTNYVENVESLDSLSRAVAAARERGAQVALDDVTSPYRAIQCCEAFHPEWVKVDWEITRGVARDPRRRSILKSLGRLARHFSFGLIAEGVETSEDLDVCAASGVVAAQGYFIGRPAPEPTAPEGAPASSLMAANAGLLLASKVGAVFSMYRPAKMPSVSPGPLPLQTTTKSPLSSAAMLG